jgi:hypothetical protein
MEILETRMHIDSWDEKPYREEPDGRKWTRAEVTLSSDEGLTNGSFEALMYYRPDGTSTYVTLMRLAGALGGRSGSVVLQGRGTYDGTTARVTATVVPGSGEDGLAGVTGEVESASTHADYPYMPLTLRYDLG